MGWSSARAVHYAFALLTKVHTDVKQRFLKEIQNRYFILFKQVYLGLDFRIILLENYFFVFL